MAQATIGSLTLTPLVTPLTVNLYDTSGTRTALCYTATDGQTAHTFPQTITAATTFYFDRPTDGFISAKYWGVEIASTAGATAPFTVVNGTGSNRGIGIDVNETLSPLQYANMREAYTRVSGAFETMPRLHASTAGAPVSQTIRLANIVLPAGFVVTNISFCSGTTAMATPANWWFALTDSAFVQLRATADQTTGTWGASTLKTLALTTPYTILAEGIYYLAVLVNAGTPPSLAGQTGNTATHWLLTPRLGCSGLAGQTVPVADGTNLAPSPTSPGLVNWAYVS